MRTSSVLIGISMILLGCQDVTVSSYYNGSDMDTQHTQCPNLPDMSALPAKCVAAQGLVGDNLICVDFTSPTILPELMSKGWNFSAVMTVDCTGWDIDNNRLHIKTANYTSFMGDCGILLPPLPSSDFQKYRSFTLSLDQKIDISEMANHKIQIMNGIDDPSNRLITRWTGRPPRQVSTVTINRSDVPGATSYQPLLKLAATTAAGSGAFSGWFIYSIAVMGIP